MGPTALLTSLKKKGAADFYRLYKRIASAEFEAAYLETNNKHTNH
jgi:hypothetical protein